MANNNKLMFVLIFLIIMVCSLILFIVYQQINYNTKIKNFLKLKEKNETKLPPKQEKKENWVISFGLYGNDPRVKKFTKFNCSIHLEQSETLNFKNKFFQVNFFFF
jgi:hypothetical protein